MYRKWDSQGEKGCKHCYWWDVPAPAPDKDLRPIIYSPLPYLSLDALPPFMWDVFIGSICWAADKAFIWKISLVWFFSEMTWFCNFRNLQELKKENTSLNTNGVHFRKPTILWYEPIHEKPHNFGIFPGHNFGAIKVWIVTKTLRIFFSVVEKHVNVFQSQQQ